MAGVLRGKHRDGRNRAGIGRRIKGPGQVSAAESAATGSDGGEEERRIEAEKKEIYHLGVHFQPKPFQTFSRMKE